MKKRNRQQMLAAVLLGGSVIVPISAYAGEAFLKLLEELRNTGAISESAYSQLRLIALEEDSEIKALAEEQVKAVAGDMPKITTKGKFQIEGDDFKWRVGGRIMVDGAIFDNGKGNSGVETDFADSAEVRRARLYMSGTMWKYWDFKTQFDFAPGDGVDLKDMYIRHTYFKPTTVTVGHFKQPFSLEELTSSKYITFMERALPNVFAPGRDLGVMVHSHGDMWQGAVGLFADGSNLGSSFNDVGEGESEAYSVTGRVSVSPIAEKDRAVHVGGAIAYRSPQGGAEVRYRTRPEAHATGIRLIDTDGVGNIDAILQYGAEAAGVFGPFSLQGEYLRTELNRKGVPDADFDGWYVYGSWFLTGESRAYDHKKGAFKGIKPNSAFGYDGFGAVEFGTRFSSLDLTDDGAGIIGGAQDDITLGVNWYPNANLRFMANYVYVLDVDRPGNDFDGAEPGIFQLRAQAHW